MSRSNRARSYDGGIIKADDYFTNGELEVARFGENVVLKNNRTPEQQEDMMKYLCSKYHEEYTQITEMVHALKEKVLDCNPYDLLMYLRSQVVISQMNITSECEYSTDDNALIHAQEFIQSILISAPLHNNSVMSNKEELYSQITEDYLTLYKRSLLFYPYWSAYIQRTNGTRNNLIREIVEAQYMYWVRGKRYQIFELEPLRALLPPHNDILNELFGVTAVEIISGLEKLRYSLSQGFADACMDLGKVFEQFCQAIDSGLEPDKIRADSSEHSGEIIRKVFGSDLINVKVITGWDDRFIKMLSAELNEQSSFWGTGEFSGWPIVDLSVMKKPFISIDGTAYAFLYYALFDNIYRNIQKGIMRLRPTYLEQWKASQTKVSEEMVRDLFLKLLPGAKSHIGNYYPKGTSLKQLNENDIIITYHGFLFIIEVKAGSFPTTPPITDFPAHIEAYKKLAEAADSQCSRTLSYIMMQSNTQFYDREKNPTFQLPQLASFEDIFTFSVTVDNFNSFAARAEKSSVISLKEETIVISYDDLLVYVAYFDSPISFLHYLKQRKSAMRVPKYQMYDELDHLGLYIFRNQYALNPSQYGGVKEVHWSGFRQEIDEYFNWLYTDPSNAHKPVQQIPELISEIVAYLDKDTSSEKIRLAHFLLDLCTDSKNEFADKIRYCKVRQKEIQRNVPIMSFGDVKYCAFITVSGVKPLSIQEQTDYTYAAASRDETLPVMWISLEYDANDKLVTASGRECRFSDLKGIDIERIKRLGELKAQDWVRIHLLKNKKIGRNDICPCGSGKKYKKCCGK